eukprot:GFYU01009087.1.p1 GENE.GFYU01009087.1~~GFYU01009087.1.p1  ORF type:complete len:192 (-),score=34.77 GFYU01009087.1:89-664(-)
MATCEVLVKSRHTAAASLEKKYGNDDCYIVDLTSKAAEPWVKFSPFYPHYRIPVPFDDEGDTAASIEGIWQGLKVFESAGVDPKVAQNDTMARLKRTCRKYGQCYGHQKGFTANKDEPLLGYLDARRQIYLPMYKWLLENRLQSEVKGLRSLMTKYKTLVLLDYETNEDVENLDKPLSHAGLVKAHLLGKL